VSGMGGGIEGDGGWWGGEGMINLWC